MEAARLFAHPLRAGTLRAWSLPNTVTGPQTPGRPFSRCSTSASRESRALQPSLRRRTVENFPEPVFCLPHSEPSSSQSHRQRHTPPTPDATFPDANLKCHPYPRPINDPNHSAPSSHPGRRQTSPGWASPSLPRLEPCPLTPNPAFLPGEQERQA